MSESRVQVSIRFTHYDEPKGKGRPRFRVIPLKRGGNGKQNYAVQTYTPEGTAIYEGLIKAAFREKYPDARPIPSTIPLAILIDAYCAVPVSDSRAKRELKLSGEIRPSKKPDADNVGKAVLDALNGIAYSDDAQIVDVHVRKWYSNQPRVEIAIIDAGRLKKPRAKEQEATQCKMEL